MPTTAPPAVRRAPTASTIAMLVTVLLTAGGWWLTHADALSPSGNQVTAPTAVGRTIWPAAGVESGGEALGLQRVIPHLLENSSGATIGVLLCRRHADPDGVGAQLDQPPHQGGSPVPFRPADVLLSQRPGGAELLVRVTPRRPGLVRNDGLDLSYRTGLRTGAKRSGVSMVVPTS